MIIQVCGHLIDTKHIYRISHVYSETDFNDISVCFKIDFVNEKSKIISINKPTDKSFYGEEYRKEEFLMISKMLEVREKLINKWKANQKIIEKIEFDESQTT